MRGFLFTIAMVSAAAVVMGLAFFVMQSSHMEQIDTASLVMFDRIRNDALWIENGFRDIVRAAGINVSVENRTITVSEPMPNTNAQNLTANLDNWKSFAEAKAGFQASLAVQDVKDYLALSFKPSLATYTHPNGPGGDTIRVDSNGQASNYSIDLDIDVSEEIDLSWSSIDDNPPNLGFRIRVHNTTDTIEDAQFLDTEGTSTLSVSMDSGTITIDIGDAVNRGRLDISNPSSLNAMVETNITLSFINEPEVTLPGDVVSLYSQAINATVSGPVRIA